VARTFIYVDGFNLFYRVKGTKHRWLNPLALAQQLLAAHNNVAKVRYFTARVSGKDDPDRPRRQHVYLNALATVAEVEVHFGRFLAKTMTRPLVKPPRPGACKQCGASGNRFVEVHSYEEKGSDVNLATHLLHDAWCGRFDVAAVISNDTDLCEPIKIVSTELKKPVGVLCPAASCAKDLKQVARFVKHISDKDLMASQFPSPLLDANGAPINKPASW
jgi:hypothetical protein